MKSFTFLFLTLLIGMLSGFPINEGFESETIPAEGWQIVYANQTPPSGNLMTHTDTAARTGVRSFRFSSYSNGAPYDQFLITPEIESNEAFNLSFWYKKHTSGSEIFSVGFSTSGDNIETDFIWTEDITNSTSSWSEFSKICDSDIKYVAIHYKSSYKYYLYIDDFSLFIPEEMEYLNSTTIQQNQNILTQGYENGELIGIEIETENELNPLVLSRINISFDESDSVDDIKNCKIYYTGNNAVFDSNSLFGSVIENPTIETFIDGNQTLLKGKNYFWLAVDIDENAIANHKVDASCTEIKIGTESYIPDVTSPEGSRTIMAALNGNYSIGNNCDFTSFQAAIDALNSLGISGNVFFNILPGEYNEQITLNEIIGVSESKQIFFKGNEEDVTSVKISFENNSVKNYVVKFNGGDFINFENISFAALDDSYGRLIVLENGSCNNRFINNIFTGIFTEDNDMDNNKNLVFSNATGATELDNNNEFIGNQFINGSMGLNLGAINFVSPFESGNKILNNSFTGQCKKCIYLNYQENIEILNNNIGSTSNYSNYYAIDGFHVRNNSSISMNSINLNCTNTTYGICLRPSSQETDYSIVANNCISIQTENLSYGIYLDGCKNLDILHNSVNLTGNNESSMGIYLYRNSNFCNVVSNILTNYANGLAMRISSNSLDGNLIDFNNYFSSGSILIQVGSDTADDIPSIQLLTGGDINSISKNITYLENLHIDDIELKIAPFNSKVPRDIDGDLRYEPVVFIGADEYIEVIPDTTPPVIISLTGCEVSIGSEMSLILVVEEETELDVDSPIWSQYTIEGVDHDLIFSPSNRAISLKNSFRSKELYVFNANIPVQELPVNGMIAIKAKDLAGNFSEIYTSEISWSGDVVLPVIDIFEAPEFVLPTEELIVKANISDESGVLEAKLFYSIEDDFTELMMVLENGYYKANIPTQPAETEVNYFITAKDASSQANIATSDTLTSTWKEISTGWFGPWNAVNNSGLGLTGQSGEIIPWELGMIYNFGSSKVKMKKIAYMVNEGTEGIINYSIMDIDESGNWTDIILDSGLLTTSPTIGTEFVEIEINSDVELSGSIGLRLSFVTGGFFGRDENSSYNNSYIYFNDEWVKLGTGAASEFTGDWTLNVHVEGFNVTNKEEIVPFNTTLSQNYPNPFNPSTVINYSLAQASDIKLQIINSNGEMVKEVVFLKQNPGIYSYNFNGENLNSGVYFYRLLTTNKAITKKMILVK
ncbi:MAG: choice-of-anchor J domain-containing protein [Candidatus Delongbacteria bacterium]|nr:choice-of-anchor J domain-containing protein [Candidatus Delongbacteria bacterium]MBN2836330.1 choice-of-anchor J domain-containing protein [Candidatus Delongbacteria bacterium]